MHGFYTIVALLAILFAGFGWGWSFTNVAKTTIDKMMKPQAEESRVVNFSNPSNGAQEIADVTVQGRIIVVPRRSNGRCRPGEQVDRRGKCRTVW